MSIASSELIPIWHIVFELHKHSFFSTPLGHPSSTTHATSLEA
jgi:hypothetical protein